MKNTEKYENCKKDTAKLFGEVQYSIDAYYWDLIQKCFLSKIQKNSVLNLLKADPDIKHYELLDKIVERVYSFKRQQAKTGYQDIVAYLRNKYVFRFNEVTNVTEYKKKGENEFQDIDNYNLNSFHHELKMKPIRVHHTFLPVIVRSSFSPKYNPFKSYFLNLPEWDQVDHIGQLSDTVKTNNTDLWKRAFKKWIVAAVGSAIDDQTINQTLIVFTSKQGLGKTTWMEKLLPVPLKNYYFSGVIDPRNKDTLVHLSECLFVNLDELENLNRNEIGELKQIITLSKIRIRRPYARVPEILVRRASLMGSVNTLEFLNDPTGSRRFLAFEANSIDYQHSIKMEKVYSQALHLYQNGYQFYFDQDEISEINDHNEQFQYKPIEEELLLEHFEPCEKEKADIFGNATHILELLSERDPVFTYNNGHKMSMGKLLKKNKFQRIKKNNLYVYALREKIKPVKKQFDDDSNIKIKSKSAFESLLFELNSTEIDKRLSNLSPVVFKYITHRLKGGKNQLVPFNTFCEIIEKCGKITLDDYDRGVLLRIAKDEHIILLPDEQVIVPMKIDNQLVDNLF